MLYQPPSGCPGCSLGCYCPSWLTLASCFLPQGLRYPTLEKDQFFEAHPRGQPPAVFLISTGPLIQWRLRSLLPSPPQVLSRMATAGMDSVYSPRHATCPLGHPFLWPSPCNRPPWNLKIWVSFWPFLTHFSIHHLSSLTLLRPTFPLSAHLLPPSSPTSHQISQDSCHHFISSSALCSPLTFRMYCYIQKIFQRLPCLIGYPSFHLKTLPVTPPDSPPWAAGSSAVP